MVGDGGHMYVSHLRLAASLLSKPVLLGSRYTEIFSKFLSTLLKELSNYWPSVAYFYFIIIFSLFVELACDLTKTTSNLHQ